MFAQTPKTRTTRSLGSQRCKYVYYYSKSQLTVVVCQSLQCINEINSEKAARLVAHTTYLEKTYVIGCFRNRNCNALCNYQ